MASRDEDGDQPPPKRLHAGEYAPPATAPSVARVLLNPADCNLDFDVGGGGLRGQALHEGGFAYCWSGARATAGVRGGGRYCFGCKVVAVQAVEMDDTEADQRNLCRVGVSRGDDPVGALGESGHSFGYGGTGKFSHQGKFFDYDVRFGVGDTVVCAVDLDSKPMASIGFSKNGEWIGIARYFDASEKGLGLVDAPVRPMQWESALFPHVLLKNVVVEMQFSREDGLEPVDGYEPWASACVNGSSVSGPVFAEQRECEVLMMVGLPASGKSTWAEKWVKEHPEKRFILLGTNLALDQMKVPGLLRKHNYGERFDRLMDHATAIFNTLLDRAAKIPHNYIIDQTNVYRSARIRKLRPFTNYRKTAVVIFPLPSELKSRAAKRFKEMGKEVPADALNQMTANFSLPLSKDMPGSKEPFDEVIFVELSRDDAQTKLDEMRHLLPRVPTPSYDNFSNQNVSSAHAGIVSQVIPAGTSSQSQNTYGGMNYQQAPQGVGLQSTTGNQHQIQPSYPNTPYQHQIHPSYPSIPNQHQIHPSYPSTTNQHLVHPGYPSTTNQHQVHAGCPSTTNQQQVHAGYPSTTNQHQTHPNYPSTTKQQQIHPSYQSNGNQHQIHPSYPSTPLPPYGHSTYAYHGSPSPYPYNTNMRQRVQGPAYPAPGYVIEATNSTIRPVLAHPSTVSAYNSPSPVPTYSSHHIQQLVPYHDVNNTGSQHAAQATWPASYTALPPNHTNPPPSQRG